MAIEFKDGKYVDPETGRVTLDPTVYKDWQIAEEAERTLPPVEEFRKKLGLEPDEIIPYGKTPKLDFIKIMNRLKDKPDGKFIEVTAITPTPLGEGKSTVSLGLVEGLGKIGKNVGGCLRQPSGGPTMNVKGTAAGGGNALLMPMTEFSLGLTGDINDIMNAHNLAMVALNARMQHERNYDDEQLAKRGLKRLDIDPKRVEMGWVLDFCAQGLRNIIIGVGGNKDGYLMESKFGIAVGSELMAILAVAKDLKDLRDRQDRGGLQPQGRARDHRGPGGRRRHDRLDAQLHQPHRVLHRGASARADPRRPLRQHRHRPVLRYRRPAGAEAV